MQVPLSIASEKRSLFRSGIGLERFGGRISADAQWLWLAVLVFVAVSIWWCTQDNRIPIWDSGAYMTIAYRDGLALRDGEFWDLFTIYTTYPPLMHLVGAISVVLFGLHPIAMTIASNLVFVPLSMLGIIPLADATGITVDAAPSQAPDSGYLLRAPRPGDPAPCQRLNDGLALYAVRGSESGLNRALLRNPARPTEQYSLICPGHATIAWPAHASS